MPRPRSFRPLPAIPATSAIPAFRSMLLVITGLVVCGPWVAAGSSSASGPERHWGRDRSVDVESIVLDLSIDLEAGRVAGRATLGVAALRHATREALLDAVELDVDEVRVDGRVVAHEHDGEVLRIPFDPPLAADARALLAIDYSAEPRAGLYFVRPDRRYPEKQLQCWSQGEAEDNRYWFPVIDHPSERATSETRIRVARPLKVVANGALEEVEDHGDGTWTWRHRLDFEHVPYLISLAIGDWETTTEDWDGVRLEYHVPKALAKHAKRSFSNTARILQFMSEETGLRYPWSVYRQTCVHEFLYGGMENITATTLNVSTLHDERAHLDWSSDSLVAHEVAHQWFGDYITLRDWSQAWLNEGFATYYASLAEQALHGPEHFVVDIDSKRKGAISADAGDKRRPVVSDVYDDVMDLFDGHAYSKGAMVLHALRRELGDEDYRRAVRRYLESCGGRSVHTHDLVAAIEEATGRDVTRFFAQWIFGAGQPELEVSWKEDGKADGNEDGNEDRRRIEVVVEQVQELSDLVALFDVPLDFLVLGEDWEVEEQVRIDSALESFHFDVPGRPWAVLVDPDGWLLRTLEIRRSTREAAEVLRRAPRLLPRIEAARELAEKAGGRRAAAALAEALADRDEHWSVRKEAAEALSKGRGSATREALLSALASDPESRVRTAAAASLGKLESREAAAALRDALWKDESYKVRGAAARSLGLIAPPGVAADLERALSQRSHRDEVVKAALDGLHSAEAPRLRRLAEEWTAWGRPEEARNHAIGLLAKLADESDDEVLREDIEGRLLELLDDPLIRTRDAAIAGLGVLRAEQARSVLAALEADSPVSRLRRSAREALRKLEAPRAAKETEICATCDELLERVEALEERLAEDDPEEP